MSNPQFKIHGLERRQVKKEVGELKRYVKYFWHYHQLDKDMSIGIKPSNGYPMSDELAQKKFDDATKQIKEMEDKLIVPYI